MGSFEQKSKFSTWLYTITYRTALDMTRKKQIKMHSVEDDTSYLQIADDQGKLPDELLLQSDLNAQIQGAIAQLKPADATLITLFYLQENSVKEVAMIMGLTETNVKTKLHRLRETLKKLLPQKINI